MKRRKKNAPSEQTVFRRRIIEIAAELREKGAEWASDKISAALEEFKAVHNNRQNESRRACSEHAHELAHLPPLVKEEEKEKKQKNKEEENDTPASCVCGAHTSHAQDSVAGEGEGISKPDNGKALKRNKPSRMPIPTLEECKEYAAESGLRLDVGRFYDHFSANGWKVGGRTAMKDWKAAMRNWARNDAEKRYGASRQESHNQPVGFVYHQPGYKPNFERVKPLKWEDL